MFCQKKLEAAKTPSKNNFLRHVSNLLSFQNYFANFENKLILKMEKKFTIMITTMIKNKFTGFFGH